MTFRKGPSEAQKQAGNYAKDHKRVLGMRVSVETRKGEFRKGKDHTGKEWSQKMAHDYGYIRGAVGKDKDHLDCFMGPHDPASCPVHVVDQGDHKGGFDEHKVVFGAQNPQQASEVYHANYEPGWRGMQDVTAMGHGDFKRWAFDKGRRVKAVAEHSAGKKASKQVPKFASGGLVAWPHPAFDPTIGAPGGNWPLNPVMPQVAVGGYNVGSQSPTDITQGGLTIAPFVPPHPMDLPPATAPAAPVVPVGASDVGQTSSGGEGGGGGAGPAGGSGGGGPSGSMGTASGIGVGSDLGINGMDAESDSAAAAAAAGADAEAAAAADAGMGGPAATGADASGATGAAPGSDDGPGDAPGSDSAPSGDAPGDAGPGDAGAGDAGDAGGDAGGGDGGGGDGGGGEKRGGLIRAPRRYGEGGAVFGRYPNLGYRFDSAQDRTDGANLPADLGRGALAGLLGAPGNMESMGRMALNLTGGGVNRVDPHPVLPDSDAANDMMPGAKPESRIGQAAYTGGELGAGGVNMFGPKQFQQLMKMVHLLRSVRPAYADGGSVAAGLASGLYGGDIGQGALQSAMQAVRSSGASGGSSGVKDHTGAMIGSLAGSFLPFPGGSIIGGFLGGLFD